MATFEFTSPDGKKYTVAGPDGATQEQAFKMLQAQMGTAQPAPSKPFGQQMNEAISDIPRQIGLTARHGIESAGDFADMLAAPMRAGINAVVPDKYAAQPGLGNKLANAIGLPQPRNATERVVGDASRMLLAGAAPVALAGKVAQAASGSTKAVASALASNPLSQIASAGSAGGAGGYVRETGGDATSQLAAALAAGVATPYAMGKTQQAGNAIKQLARGPAAPTPQQIDITINSAMQGSGMVFDDLTPAIKAGIRQDVADAYRLTGAVDPASIRRLADYRLTNTTPTAATLTLDPATVSQQKNLAKQGINSKDVSAQALGQTENANNRTLIGGLNELGAGTPDTAIVGGRKVIGALDDRIGRAKSAIDARYTAARATNGRAVELDPSAFTKSASAALDEAMIGGKLPADVQNKLNAIASGEHPLNVDIAEQLKTRIGDLQRASSDKAERLALGMVRKALDDAPLLNDGAGMGQESIHAFNRARKLNRAWEGIVERTPALQAVRDGIEPDKFVQQFIVGGGGKANTADLAALQRSVKGSPEAVTAVKQQIAAHLKKAALNNAADEVGNISQSAYNKALNGIGDEKLSMFFTRPEVNQLRAIGRVASYEQFQPRGSAVGNSNTGAVVMSSLLDRLANSALLSKMPAGSLIQQPLQNITIGMNSGKALSAPDALAIKQLMQPKQSPGVMLSPAALMWNGSSDQ